MSLQLIAERIARAAHAGQQEKGGGDYIRHVERVVAEMPDSEPLRLVAWLHDVIEDSEVTAEDLRVAGFPEAVVEAVVLLTRGTESYAEYIERLWQRQNRLAIHVKIVDLRDHLRADSAYTLTESSRRRYERAIERLG